ncbi:MAG TPA: class I SAM-dependent methyltransferase [Solirubrobacteraceae bacterium]|jgi:demethylmenaquinone methyltransferase/2-methoxy-6-polyprenyl-1,4-benzoquinol methylase|nr:class I SAM-dependent methyltransferase [Solirubrobacteraceae bacterium]
MTDDTLLAEQLDYYRARAGEYDQWWLRQGRFDRGAEANARWFEETHQLERVVDEFDPSGDVLELAGGTGLWTRRLAARAAHLTVLDAAPEVLAINRERVGDPTVTYTQADLFDYTPQPGAYDVCFFSFWLSHVPADRFAAFWHTVATALKPGGRVLFIDSARTERSTAADHRLPEQDEQTMTRRLDDGREFQIVKRFYDPGPLETELAGLGWDCRVTGTGEFFIHGTATRA